MKHTIEQVIADRKAFNEERKAIYDGNKALIKEWDSIPWWKFWEKVSFEKRTKYIADSYKVLERYFYEK